MHVHVGSRVADYFSEAIVLATNKHEVTRMKISCFSMIVLVAMARAQSTGEPPRFEDYSVVESWQSTPAPVKLTTTSERMFKTRLVDAAKKPPDFAGHFRFVDWGCGSNCAAGAVVNLKTGDVLPPPGRGGKTGWDRWIYCASWWETSGVEYRVNSRMIKIRCGMGEGDTYYFVLENEAFKLLSHIPPKKPIP